MRINLSFDDEDDALKKSKQNKLFLYGELSESDWKNSTSRALQIQVPLVCGMSVDEISVDVDAARGVARVRSIASTLVGMDVLVRLPSACRVAARGGRILHAVDAMKTYESSPMRLDDDATGGTMLNLSLPHANNGRWWELTLALYKAGLRADGVAWASTWAEMKSLAIEELPAVVDERVDALVGATGLPEDLSRSIADREVLASFEDHETRPTGWSHCVCRFALFAVQECAWKAFHAKASESDDGVLEPRSSYPSSAPKLTDAHALQAKRMMEELLREGDVTLGEVLEMIRNDGLCRGAVPGSSVLRSLDESEDWVMIQSDGMCVCFIHRVIVDRFALMDRLPISVMLYGHMPIFIKKWE